jgi:FRG domain
MSILTTRFKENINSVPHFVSEVVNLSAKENQKLWYRGLSKSSYPLTPMIGRPLKYAGNKLPYEKQSEKNILHRFRRRAYPHTGRTITAGEAIFMARHHGLPTRLLDWTANALFSLYFACHKHRDHNGKIWAMLRRSDENNDIDAFTLAQIETEKKLFNYRKSGDSQDHAIKIIHPFYNTPRLLAQDGVFTIHSHPEKSMEDYANDSTVSFKEENLDIVRLYWWCVPKDNKVTILKGLSGLGVTRRSVYPDLDGVAQSLWETEVLWRCRLH